jgi:hypothetical protein
VRVWISAEVCLSGCGAAAWRVVQPLSLPAGSCVGRFVIDHRNSGKDCHLFAHEAHNRNSGRDSLHLVCRSEEIGSWKMIWGPRRLDVSFSPEERRIPRDFLADEYFGFDKCNYHTRSGYGALGPLGLRNSMGNLKIFRWAKDSEGRD